MEQAFLETNYIILIDEPIVLKIGELPEEMIQRFPTLKTWAFITAWNPLPDIYEKEENDKRNAQLKDILEQNGFVVHPGIGISKQEDWSEESFFIENIDLESANAYSSKFGQLAFVYGDRENGNQLVFTVG
jgi:hypothetical protein